MTRKYLFKKTDFINTDALRKYRKEKNLTNEQIAATANVAGLTASHIHLWIRRKRAPRQVLRSLGIAARNFKAHRDAIEKTATPRNGGLFVSYVGQEHREAFMAFCSSLRIDTKEFL